MLQFCYHSVKSTILPKDYQLRDQDVMCGRGLAWNHNGSRVFKGVIQGTLNDYVKAKKGPFENKSNFVKHMVRLFRDRGVLFVKFDRKNNHWSDVGDQQVFEKISHAFRDSLKKMAHERRRQQQQKGTQEPTENDIKKTNFFKAKKSNNLPMLKQRKIVPSNHEYTNYLPSTILSINLENNATTVKVASENTENKQCIPKQVDKFLSSSLLSPLSPSLRKIKEGPENTLDSFESPLEIEFAFEFPLSFSHHKGSPPIEPLNHTDVLSLLNADIIEYDLHNYAR